MPDITAVILAAGLGVRMGPRGRLTPKGLIEISGEALVVQSVNTLRGWGIGRILIVTGHLADHYDAIFAGTDVSLIHNPDYGSTGSLRTLQHALAAMEGPCLIVESDLIYAPQAIDHMEFSRDCFLTSSHTNAGDEVWVWTKQGSNLQTLSKDLNAHPEAPFGEMVGLTYLQAKTVPKLRAATDAVLAKKPKAHYEDGLVELAREVGLYCALADGLAWAEIDNEDMLTRVTDDVYPKIAAARALYDNLRSK